MRDRWWTQPAHIDWIQLVLRSFRHWVGRDLLDRAGTPQQEAEDAYAASFVLVTHDRQDDPILNYGNRAALALWGMTWEDFSRTPSRLTAEGAERSERARMLADATHRGYIEDYRGVRISRSGRRFLIEQATVWNVLDPDEKTIGQAASFSMWHWLDGKAC